MLDALQNACRTQGKLLVVKRHLAADHCDILRVREHAVKPEHLHDHCRITITLLLAMSAFKFVFAEKLPNIRYAIVIDLYVLVCFSAVFLIVILQFCIAVGVISEDVFQYVSIQPAPKQRKTRNWHNSGLCDGVPAGTMVMTGPSVCTVKDPNAHVVVRKHVAHTAFACNLSVCSVLFVPPTTLRQILVCSRNSPLGGLSEGKGPS